jgi:hypothetical protein
VNPSQSWLLLFAPPNALPSNRTLAFVGGTWLAVTQLLGLLGVNDCCQFPTLVASISPNRSAQRYVGGTLSTMRSSRRSSCGRHVARGHVSFVCEGHSDWATIARSKRANLRSMMPSWSDGKTEMGVKTPVGRYPTSARQASENGLLCEAAELKSPRTLSVGFVGRVGLLQVLCRGRLTVPPEPVDQPSRWNHDRWGWSRPPRWLINRFG